MHAKEKTTIHKDIVQDNVIEEENPEKSIIFNKYQNNKVCLREFVE